MLRRCDARIWRVSYGTRHCGRARKVTAEAYAVVTAAIAQKRRDRLVPQLHSFIDASKLLSDVLKLTTSVL